MPPVITFEDELFDLAFHPTQHVLAAASVTGQVFVYKYSAAKNELVFELAEHTGGCRSCLFSGDGQAMYTGSSDQSIQCIDVEKQAVNATLSNAHSAAVNTMMLVDTGSASLLVSGDDDGTIKLWDVRQQSSVGEYKHHGDFISGLTSVEDKKLILASSGDGSISVTDWRADHAKAINLSEQLDDEPLCIQTMKDLSRVVVGTQEGTLGFYKWGEWGDICDRMVGHPGSIDAMVKINEDILCTGCSDGKIRVVRMHPNKILGVIGEHQDYPVSSIQLSGDGELLGSCSDDKRVKFWSTEVVQQLQDGQSGSKRKNKGGGALDEDDSGDEARHDAKKAATKQATNDDDDDDEDGEDGEDDDEEGEGKGDGGEANDFNYANAGQGEEDFF